MEEIEMLDEGIYYMQKPKVGIGGKEGKTPYIYVSGDITHKREGEHNAKLDDPIERTMFWYASDKSWDFTRERLERVGFNGNMKDPQLDEKSAKGLWVECKHETYEGKTRDKWDLPGVGGGGSIDHGTPDAKTIRVLQSMWGDSKTNDDAPPPPSDGIETAEDDIPF
jgi:hypothetical protein